MQAAEQLDATVIDMRFVKPIDEQAIIDAARAHQLIVTVEENAVSGGAGSAVLEVLAQHKLSVNTLTLGLPDEFIKHGSQDQVRAELGLDAAGIEAQIKSQL
jgi:1-deoxy-D-xylulose-5-phosphate synthase